MKALQPEHWGGRAQCQRAEECLQAAQAELDSMSPRVSQTSARDYTAPRLHGGGSLLTEGSLAHSHH